MCGILGIVTVRGKELSVRRDVIVRMRDRLSHRGPDDAGLWRTGHVALAHRRLAILDPAHGSQPMTLVDERGQPSLVLTYNGEIYNHVELRRELTAAPFATTCDTETLLHALAEWGEGAVHRLRGMYAFALYDAQKEQLTLARDPLGIKPLYYAIVDVPGGKELVFASEPTAILDHPHMRVEPDWVTVSAYLSTIRTTLGRRSMFAGLNVLQPGEVLQCDLSGPELVVTITAAHDEQFDSELGDDYGEAVRLARSVMTESVQAHLLSDVPTCALLSGGLDSTITSVIASRHIDGLRTYCSGAVGEDGSDDFAFARLASQHIGTAHTDVVIGREDFAELWPWMVGRLGVPLSTPNEVAIYAVARELSKEAKVTISGEGADEFFAGYEPPLIAALRYIENPVDDAGGPLSPHRFYLQANSWIPIELKSQLLCEPIVQASERDGELVQCVREAFAAGGDGGDAGDGGDGMRDLEAHLRVQRRFNLTGLLGRLDTSTMLASVEGRTPFSDRVVAAFAGSLPFSHKFTSNGEGPNGQAVVTKRVLRDAFADMVPDSIRRRPKASFPLPFQGWLADQTHHLETSSTVREVFTEPAIGLLAADPQTNWLAAWPVLNIAIWLHTRWG
ncbi:MAG: asparagine synthase (glutamine-hydrolyzing) [Phycisphaerales bacterium]|nr:asparagine synthase (glutamine-hydrolyzing) [Phycisphaerales bacterium]